MTAGMTQRFTAAIRDPAAFPVPAPSRVTRALSQQRSRIVRAVLLLSPFLLFLLVPFSGDTPQPATSTTLTRTTTSESESLTPAIRHTIPEPAIAPVIPAAPERAIAPAIPAPESITTTTSKTASTTTTATSTLTTTAAITATTTSSEFDLGPEPPRHYMPDGSLSLQSACDALVRHPVPYNASQCEGTRNMTSNLCRDGTATMMSQFRQDYYLYTTHFRHLPRSRRGVYLDVAAHSAIRISNSWFFDACLGWRGVCVEGNPKYTAELSSVRTCDVVPTCAGSSDGETVDFALANGLGGVVGTNKNMDRFNGTKVGMVKLICTTIATVVKEKGIRVVDYLSLDVEGHELNVLKGIKWGPLKINVITVESNDEKVARFLEKRGYVKRTVKRGKRLDVPTMLQDDLYVRKDVVWGQPV